MKLRFSGILQARSSVDIYAPFLRWSVAVIKRKSASSAIVLQGTSQSLEKALQYMLPSLCAPFSVPRDTLRRLAFREAKNYAFSVLSWVWIWHLPQSLLERTEAPLQTIKNDQQGFVSDTSNLKKKDFCLLPRGYVTRNYAWIILLYYPRHGE